MGQSLAQIILHVVFSTKGRYPWLEPAIRVDLHPFLAGVARQAGCQCMRVGGVADHVHLAIGLGRQASPAGLVCDLKSASSKWLKTRAAGLGRFAWQTGYGCFSLGPDALPRLIAYIENQEEHHRRRTFQEEYRAFLDKYAVDYDERYVWD